MRKYQQTQILETVKSLAEATGEMKRFYSKGELEAVRELLAACQEAALGLGDFIEEIAGGGTIAVAQLDEYGKLLYELYNGLEEADSKFTKRLTRELIKIENSVKDGLKPDRMELVFFPYRASMWDSLESIWRAAKEDPQCDAYVVPIPYYEINPDGSRGAMHCDIEQYPEDVPVVDWRDYHVEERHPEAAFIHYAYDDKAGNATVDPAFYSEHLKEHCGMLVYVPYFVSMGDTVGEYNGYLPGVLHAGLVAVENETIRQDYIRLYKKFDREQKWKGRYGKAESKFLALGSPKYDKVASTKREDCPLPPAWETLLSSGKKAILYNTHMFTMLKGGQDYFRKMREVFALFRGREDVVLWWRPHPNTELNIRTKRPGLYGEYSILVSEFRESGCGIYDDTPDLDRAIAWTDGYYGDWSSLVALYRAAGKPILMQSITTEFPEPGEPPVLRFWDAVRIGEELWFSAAGMNGLFRADIRTGTAEFVGEFPGEENKALLHTSVAAVGNALVFSPRIAETIAVYHRDTGKWDCFPVGETGKPYKYGGAAAVGGSVFLLPFHAHDILRLDVETEKLDRIANWCPKELLKRAEREEERYRYIGLMSGSCVVGRTLYAVCLNGTHILRLDTETMERELVALPGDARYSGICYDGERFWLTPYTEGPVLVWDGDAGFREITEYPTGFVHRDFSFTRCMFAKGSVWLLPSGRANMLVRIDPETGAMTAAAGKPVDAMTGWRELVEDGDGLLAWDIAGQLHRLDAAGREQEALTVLLPETLRERAVRAVCGAPGIRNESAFAPLPVFLDGLAGFEARPDAGLTGAGERTLAKVKEAVL